MHANAISSTCTSFQCRTSLGSPAFVTIDNVNGKSTRTVHVTGKRSRVEMPATFTNNTQMKNNSMALTNKTDMSCRNRELNSKKRKTELSNDTHRSFFETDRSRKRGGVASNRNASSLKSIILDHSSNTNSYRRSVFNNASHTTSPAVWPLNMPQSSNYRRRSINKTEERRKHRRRFGISYSPLCMFCCCFYALLFLAGLAALLVALLFKSLPTVSTTNAVLPTTVSSSTDNSTTSTTDSSTSTTSFNVITTEASINMSNSTMVSITPAETSLSITSILTSHQISTQSISTASTTTITSTFIPPHCNTSCLNQTWITSTGLLARWQFEGSYDDQTNTYNATPSTSHPTFVQGFVGQAVSFTASSSQLLSTSYIPLASRSFTIDGWIYPTGYPGSGDNTIVGLCSTTSGTNPCLHIVLRHAVPSTTALFHFGFYGDDVNGNTSVSTSVWVHAAFVFDMSTMTQMVYRNGVLDSIVHPAAHALLASSSSFYIGDSPGYNGASSNNYYQGYIDQLSVNGRARSACEILEIATLAARFTFDNSSAPLTDSGPNSVSSNASDYTITSGHLSQCISFTGSATSSMQASGFAALGIANQAFSISLWILPQALSGVLVQFSAASSCRPILAFSSNGSLVAQVALTSGSYRSIYAPSLLSTTYWSHIALTWSATNGLRLYINNILISSATAVTLYTSGSLVNLITIGTGSCSAGAISSPSPFAGSIDSLNIFSRELTTDDVCTLYGYS